MVDSGVLTITGTTRSIDTGARSIDTGARTVDSGARTITGTTRTVDSDTRSPFNAVRTTLRAPCATILGEEDVRPDWDTYFIDIATVVASRSTCDRASVGAVIVRDKRILTTGFNGSPTGQPHCDEAGHLLIGGHCARTIHAELNAIIQAALHGIPLRGATCYLTHFPCHGCAKALANAGIVRVVYKEAYRVDPHAVDVFEWAGIGTDPWQMEGS